MALKGNPLASLNLERLKLENLYATYLGMTGREQVIAFVATVVVVVLVILLPVMVASSSISSLKKEIRENETVLHDIVRELEAYQAGRTELEALEKELSGGFDSSIATTLEGLADKAGIKDRIDSLKEKNSPPSDLFETAAVDVRLKKVALPELMAFLFAIEHHPEKVLRLDLLDIKPRFDNKQDLDAAFTVSTFRLQTAEGAE